MAEQVWAIVSGSTCAALAVTSDAGFAQSQGWLGPYTQGAPNTPGGHGWTTPDNGTTWVAPVTPAAVTNQATIQANVLAAQTQIAAFIANNPSGAVLNAAQTLVLAKMLNGLCKLLLQEFSDTTGT